MNTYLLEKYPYPYPSSPYSLLDYFFQARLDYVSPYYFY